jgi:anti-sigma regulatory factor (Ser/Thr protein kinase)
MTKTAAALDQQMIQFVLPSIPESVRIARFHVRAALSFHNMGDYGDDAEIITSELVTNVVQHVANDLTESIGVTLVCMWIPRAIAIIVSDSSREGPIRRETSATSERGQGLQVVEALSVHWGWRPKPDGKVIFAVIAREE